MYEELSKDLISKIDIAQIQDYAFVNGWVQVGGIKGNITVYHHRSNESSEVIVPKVRQLRDYDRRVAEAVITFAQVEKRSPANIVEDLLAPPSDIFKLRVNSSGTANGTVPMDEAINLIRGVKDALFASARAVTDPAKYYKRLSHKNAKVFTDRCRVGQSEYGSYVATFICPLRISEIEQRTLWEPATDTYARQATKKFMVSSQRLVSAIEYQNPERIIDAQNVNDLLSANFCEAIALLEPRGEDSSVSIQAFWGRTIRPPGDEIQTILEIKKEYFSIIKHIAKELRPHDEPQTKRFVGNIVSLQGQKNDEGQMEGDVIFRFYNEDELSRAKVRLTPQDYQKACNAHRDGSEVTFQGTLRLMKVQHSIENYSNFTILQEDAEV